jgi:hypothetical protein
VIAGPIFPNYGKRPITLRVMDDHRVENIACRIEIEYFYRNSKTFGTRILSLLDGHCPRPGRCFLHPLEFHILQGRGIALSTPFDDNEPEFTALEPSVTTVLDLLVPRQKERLLNVNIPLPSTGIRWTRQSVRHYDRAIVPDKDPKGREHFWFTVTPLEKAEPGTDRWAVENGWTSITPLRLDLTDEPALSAALQEFKHQN